MFGNRFASLHHADLSGCYALPTMRKLTSAALSSLALLTACCSGSVVRGTRSHLGRGDLAGAIEAAGEDREALGVVALEILAAGMNDPDTRSASARGLRAAGYVARATLRELSRSDDAVVSALAAEALAGQGDGRARRSLEGRLDHPDGMVRAAALRALARGRRDPTFFLPFLEDTDSRVRAAAVDGLGRLEGVSAAAAAAAPLAEAARRDPQPQLRAAALRALARVDGGSLLLDTIRAALGDAEVPVRQAAIAVLGRSDDRDSAESLLRERMSAGEPAEAVRAAAILARWGDEDAREHLRLLLREGNPALAGAAAIGAAQVGEEMLEPLMAALERPEPEIRMQVAASLMTMGQYDRAAEELARLLGHPGWLGIQAALALLGERELIAREHIERGLDHEDVQIRALTASVCGRLPGGVGLARRVLQDDSPRVRVAAAAAIIERLYRGRNG